MCFCGGSSTLYEHSTKAERLPDVFLWGSSTLYEHSTKAERLPDVFLWGPSTLYEHSTKAERLPDVFLCGPPHCINIVLTLRGCQMCFCVALPTVKT